MMVIRELKMNNFGKFCHKNIGFEKGINVVCGNNESGKTTVYSFIKTMIFGMCDSKGESRRVIFDRLKPWGREYDFSGSIKIQEGNDTYLIKRKFFKDHCQTECIDESDDKVIQSGMLDSIDVFSDIYEIGQVGALGNDKMSTSNKQELVLKLKKHMISIATTRNNDLDILQSLEILKSKKQSIISNNTKESLAQLKEKVLLDDRDNDRLNALKVREEELEKQLKKSPTVKEEESVKTIKQYVEQFDDIKDEYKKYQELVDQRQLMIDIDDRIEVSQGTAHRQFPILVIVITMLLNLILFLSMKVNVVSILMCIGIVFLAGVIMYLCNERVTEFLITKECERRLANEQYTRDTIDSLNSQIVEKQKLILEYAKRVYPMSGVNNEEMFKLEQEIVVISNQVDGFSCRLDKSEHDIQLEIDKIKWDIERISSEQRFRDERKDKYKELLFKLEDEEREIQAIELAITTIEEIADELSGGFACNLREITSDYCKKLTNNKYSGIVIDDKFDIMVLEDEKYVNIEALSTGTIEQIYLAFKLAMVDLLDDKRKMPILLDEAFAYYDDKRLVDTLKILSDIADRQIIIFTCHKREGNILSECNINYNLVEL